jgi:hypothetical protein
MFNLEPGGGSCSFITIPNGLRQHAIPERIILFALAKGLIEKLPQSIRHKKKATPCGVASIKFGH